MNVEKYIKEEIDYVIENYDFENFDLLDRDDIQNLFEYICDRATHEIDNMIYAKIQDLIELKRIESEEK